MCKIMGVICHRISFQYTKQEQKNPYRIEGKICTYVCHVCGLYTVFQQSVLIKIVHLLEHYIRMNLCTTCFLQTLNIKSY